MPSLVRHHAQSKKRLYQRKAYLVQVTLPTSILQMAPNTVLPKACKAHLTRNPQIILKSVTQARLLALYQTQGNLRRQEWICASMLPTQSLGRGHQIERSLSTKFILTQQEWKGSKSCMTHCNLRLTNTL